MPADVGMILAIGVILVWLVLLWLISPKAPRGMILVIAGVAYAASWLISPGESRALNLVVGTMRGAGIAGLLLGLLDLFRRRKKRPPGDQAAGQAEAGRQDST